MKEEVKHGYYTMGIYLLVPIALVIDSANWIMVFASLWVFFLLMLWLQILVWNTKVHLSSLVIDFTRITKHPVWAAGVFEHFQCGICAWGEWRLLMALNFFSLEKLLSSCLLRLQDHASAVEALWTVFSLMCALFFQMFIHPFMHAAAIICTYMERVVSWTGETS
jgi:hypothetical protein